MQIGDATTVENLRKLSVKRVITLILIGMMYGVVVLSVIELGWTLYQNVISPPFLLLEIRELLDILGLFLLVLIAIELLDTIQAYLRENIVHAEIVLEVAVIAVARKIIILDIERVPPLTVMGLALLIVALAAGYYIVKNFRRKHNSPPEGSGGS